MPISSVQKQINELIAASKLEKAIDLLLQSVKDPDLTQEIRLQAATLEQLKREVRKGVVDRRDEVLARNKITNALLQITEELTEKNVGATNESPQSDNLTFGKPAQNHLLPALIGLGLLIGIVGIMVFSPCPSSSQFFVYRIALAIGVAAIATIIPGFFEVQLKPTIKAGGALAVFAFIYLINPVGSISGDSCNQPFDFTIFIVDEGGMTSLREKGSISLMMGNDRRTENIDPDGSVSFKRISPDFAGDTLQVQLEADGWQFQNGGHSTIVILDGISQNLIVEQDNSRCCISGSVRGEQSGFLSGVTLNIGDVFVESDANGRYNIEVPTELQSNEYILTAQFSGYKIWEGKVYPTTGAEVSIVLQK